MNVNDETLRRLMAACDAAITQAKSRYRRLYDEAVEHNNHTPCVGQTIHYMPYPMMPEWVGAMEIALAEIKRKAGKQ